MPTLKKLLEVTTTSTVKWVTAKQKKFASLKLVFLLQNKSDLDIPIVPKDQYQKMVRQK